MTKQVVATVGGREITSDDVNLALMHAPKEHAMHLNSPEGKQHLLNEMIIQEMMYLDAIEKEYDTDPEYVKELETLKESFLKQYAIKKLISQSSVDENEAKEYYESNRNQFEKPESVRALHILIKDEETAQKIYDEIKNGKSFEEAAKEYSVCPSKEKGGDLGYFEKGKMVPEFEKVSFELEVGQISEPVKSMFGYHIIKVEDKKESTVMAFEEVKKQIEDYILRTKQNTMFKEYTDKLKDKYEVTTNEELIK